MDATPSPPVGQRPPRPVALPVDPAGIPGELKSLPQWILWRYTWVPGEQKWDKPPRKIDGGAASSTDRKTWSTFDEVLRGYQAGGWDGIGFVPTADDPFVLLDFDHVVGPEGIGTWSAELRKRFAGDVPEPAVLVARLDTYTELTPSGTGLRPICRGTLPKGRRKIGGKGNGCPDGLEMYKKGHYLTITGHRLPESPATICECNGQLSELHTAVFGTPKDSKAGTERPKAKPAAATGFDPGTDAEIIEKASQAGNGAKFRQLWSGDATGYPSESEADLALASMLAFWTGPNAACIEHLMRQSSLRRAKWDQHKTYLAETIGKALEGKTEFYAGLSTPSGDTAEQKETAKPSPVKVMADSIGRDNYFAQDAGGKLYRFSDGVYRRHAEEFIRGRVKSLCLKRAVKWSSHLASEVVEFIRVDSPRLWERPPIDVVNVRNGLLSVADRKLLPHDPDHLSPVQLPVVFDPTARCPKIEAFVEQVFPPDAHALAWEIPAWLVLPDTSIQKAVLLTGEGANGKSTWLNLVATFLGKANVSGVSLHKLEADRFAAARLIGKLANICPDLPSEHLVGTSVFKAITGGDTLVGEHKFRDSFDFTPFCRLVFSANHPPRSQDSSHAFFRRWLVVPFDHTFSPNEQIPRDVLDAMMTTATEMSGMLNRALDALDRLRERRAFSEPQSVRLAWEDFHATTDLLAVWIDAHTIAGPDAVVVRDALRAAYNQYAREAGSPPLGQEVFGRALRKLRPEIHDGQRTYGGKRQWCYIGIGFRTQDPAAAHAAQDAQV